MPRASRFVGPLLVGLVCSLSLAIAVPAHSQTRPFALYVLSNPNGGANAVAGYQVSANGAITALPGSPYSTGGNGLNSTTNAEYAHRIAVSWSKNRLFAANEQQGSIAVFNIDPLTGVLSAVAGSPFSVATWAGSGGTSLTVSNDGTMLYGSNASVVSFRVDANGALTEVGAEWVFASRINGSVVSFANDRLYLAQSDRVSVLKTGASGLSSSPPLSLSIGSTPTDVAVNQAGTRLYVGTKSGGVAAFRVEGDTFSPLAGSPYFGGASGLSGLSPDFYERSLIAFGTSPARLAVGLLASDGSLGAGPGSPLMPSIAPSGGSLSPDGGLYFMASSGSLLDAYKLEDSGALTHLASYPTSLGLNAGQIKMVAFPFKAGSAVPALPHASLWLLGVAFSFVGVVALRRRARRAAA